PPWKPPRPPTRRHRPALLLLLPLEVIERVGDPVKIQVIAPAERPWREQPLVIGVPPARLEAVHGRRPPVVGYAGKRALRLRRLIARVGWFGAGGVRHLGPPAVTDALSPIVSPRPTRSPQPHPLGVRRPR